MQAALALALLAAGSAGVRTLAATGPAAPVSRAASGAPAASASSTTSAVPAGPASPVGVGARAAGAVVIHARLASIIQPVAAEFLRGVLARADAAGAAAVVVELDTPGGLATSMHQMTEDILAARTPVVVYVAPSGAQAASAGFFLLEAADVAAMAPGTRTGAAHPVGAGGESITGTLGQKVEQDAAAAIRSLAARNGRDLATAEQAVVASRSFSAGEAVAAHLADLISPSLPELLRAIDGRRVRTGGAAPVVLHTAGAAVTEVEMTGAQRLLSALAHPELAYMLLMLGGVGLFFEITHPGTLMPGVFGAIALLLAFFGLSLLAVNYVGAALILLGVGLFVAELKAGAHGVLALSGAVALIIGSLLLFSSPEPELRVSLEWITVVTLLTLSAVCTLLVVAWQVRRRQVRTGAEGLVRERGVARSELRPLGKVFVHGELWNAEAELPVAAGDPVEVTAVRDMTLAVRPLQASSDVVGRSQTSSSPTPPLPR
ncbi:MAG TPA: nodulation protein NfeD [Thermoanaerobaculia bacterium]|nr:nodulation protein NfeD [Thermoanaerobaculia bacterium]